MNLKQTIRRILREEDYSPAGKEIIPNNIVIHKSNPMFRDKIKEDGLKVRAGECYKIYVGYGTKCRPAIFATNSTNKRAWFDSTYDDDIWEINTEMIPDVKWYKDRHYESRSKHIVTFQDIPKEAITLKYEGTGSGDVKLWNKDSPNIVKESIRRILREELNEVRVPRSERVELYKDDNIIVVVPLTHRALQKYATNCQWCINDDLGEWKDYHQGKHAVIIQRKPKKEKIGITGQPIASEILMMSRWDEGGYRFKDVCEILGYQFKDEQEMGDYYVTISNDINNFATNIVYYSPENGIYDMEDNFLWNFNIEINDIPNVGPKVIEIMDDYLKNNG